MHIHKHTHKHTHSHTHTLVRNLVIGEYDDGKAVKGVIQYANGEKYTGIFFLNFCTNLKICIYISYRRGYRGGARGAVRPIDLNCDIISKNRAILGQILSKN